jgi:aflatoxin B1 aldehyde reductase
MVKTIFGGAGLSEMGKFNTPEIQAQALDVLLANGITMLDTARLYPGSEVAIGAQPKRTEFSIDTKLVGGFAPGAVTEEGVLKDAQDSLARVNIKQFDILYAPSHPHIIQILTDSPVDTSTHPTLPSPSNPPSRA